MTTRIESLDRLTSYEPEVEASDGAKPAVSHPKNSEEALWQRLKSLRPALASKVPPECDTPNAKLVFVATHRELAKTLKGIVLPMTVSMGEGNSLTVDTALALELNRGKGQQPLKFNNRHDDLARLLDCNPSLYAEAATARVDDWLTTAVSDFYANPAFDAGSENAQNQRGGSRFRFTTLQQVLFSENPKQVGLECLGCSNFHLYMGSGLIPPNLSRRELEERYTSIRLSRSTDDPFRLSKAFDNTLRGNPSGTTKMNAAETIAFANALLRDDWAKLTGAAARTYQYRALNDIDAVKRHFEGGGGPVHAAWANRGHYFVVSDVLRDRSGKTVVVQDDSLWQTEVGPPRAYRFDPNAAAHFWAMTEGQAAVIQSPATASSFGARLAR